MEKPLLLLFLRFVMGYVFVFSLTGKLRNIPSFVQTITNFLFFPSKFSRPLAYIILIGEVSVVVAMLIGKNLLLWGFLITSLMFLAFSIALSSVIVRNIKTSCNCFGPDEKEVNVGHVVRSLGFLVCGIGGMILTKLPFATSSGVGIIEMFLIGVFAVVFVILMMQISEVIKIFQLLLISDHR
jgi:uncharacterized membrane protein YphA (DoxX/SURF4 family)